MPEFTLRLRRYDPESGNPPYWDEHPVDLAVLDWNLGAGSHGLQLLAGRQDPVFAGRAFDLERGGGAAPAEGGGEVGALHVGQAGGVVRV